MKKLLLCSLTLLVVLPLATAQSSGKQEPVKKVPANYKVTITMKNETDISGVVLQGRFIEKKVYGRYVATKNYRAEGAGLRLWYVSHTAGFTFIPYLQVKRMKRKKLAYKDFQEIVRLVNEKSAKAKGQNKKVRPSPDAFEVPQTGTPKQRQDDIQQQLSREQLLESLPQEARDFLQSFPAEDGWGPARFRQLNPRFPDRINALQRTFVIGFRRYGALLTPFYPEQGADDEEPPTERQ